MNIKTEYKRSFVESDQRFSYTFTAIDLDSKTAIVLWLSHKDRIGTINGYSGGVEKHESTPPDWRKNEPPTRKDCHILGCECWHDGSTLMADEWIRQLWNVNYNNVLDQLIIAREEFSIRALQFVRDKLYQELQKRTETPV